MKAFTYVDNRVNSTLDVGVTGFDSGSVSDLLAHALGRELFMTTASMPFCEMSTNSRPTLFLFVSKCAIVVVALCISGLMVENESAC